MLVVEPDPAARIVARNQLAASGFEVIGVSGVREASAVVAVREVSAAIVDLECALAYGMDARRLSRFLRVSPVLFSGAARSPGSRAYRGFRAQTPYVPSEIRIAEGSPAVIEKPFLPGALVDAVQAALARTERVGRELGPSPRESAAHLHDGLGHRQPEGADLAAAVQAELSRQGLALDPPVRRALARVCQQWSADTVRPSMASEGGRLVVDGDLARVSLDQVFQLAMGVGGQAGCLLEHGDAAVEVYFSDQSVVFARQRNLPEGFTLGRILVALGFVAEHHVEALASPVQGGPWIGQRLLRHGLLGDQDLVVALSRQAEELVFEAARWPGGRFSIFADVELPAAAKCGGVRVSAHLLLLEGMRRLDDWARMSGEVGDLRSVVCRSEAVEPVAGDLGLGSSPLMPEDQWVLERMEGDSTVMDLVRRLRRPTYHVFRALHRLVTRRLVDVRPVSA